jgi:hypothetical protein
MGVDVIRLKLLRESFYLVFGKLAPLGAVVLCEGYSDAEVAKRILQKMESEGVIGRISLKVGFTDVGGKDNVPKMLNAILSLTRSSRDPLLASLGGFTPPPSGLSDLRSDARTSSFYRIPMLGASHFSWRGPACLGGKDPLGTVYLVF